MRSSVRRASCLLLIIGLLTNTAQSGPLNSTELILNLTDNMTKVTAVIEENHYDYDISDNQELVKSYFGFFCLFLFIFRPCFCLVSNQSGFC